MRAPGKGNGSRGQNDESKMYAQHHPNMCKYTYTYLFVYNMYIYMVYIYIHTYIYIHINIHIYIYIIYTHILYSMYRNHLGLVSNQT